ncbi:MAG: RsmB/NOP family class I SAM-dependent RNA methyltransferase [Clostridiales bacterium]|nr:RsmB/NOP family class I SAM-dependent RNA methyltransferase [Clostridiales bacterium]
MGVAEREAAMAGLPEEFQIRMRRMLGTEYPEFLKSYEAGRTFGLRFNTLKDNLDAMVSRHEGRFGLRPVPWCREGFYYEESTRPGRHPYHEAGVYYLQEPSAMAAVELLNPKPGERVLDLCAAPGGKTSHIAERLHGDGLLVSNEIHPARAKILSQNVERMGVENAIVMNEDSTRLSQRFPDFFDRILVDAPCSGEGMFRKDERARTEWSAANVRNCVRMQEEIQDRASQMLKPGGRLVYSTCTFAPEEDEQAAEAFLERHPDFHLLPAPDGWSAWGLSQGCPEWTKNKELDIEHTVRIWPQRTEGEGHFLALFEKKPQSVLPAFGSTRREEKTGRGGGQKPAPRMDREEILCMRHWFDESLTEHGKERFFRRRERTRETMTLFGDQVYRLPEPFGEGELSGLHVLRPGLHLGTLKKNRFEPSHALALFFHADDVRHAVDYPAESGEIRAYLAGESLPAEGSRKGWTLVCTDGYSIGWAKASGGILKNHYPKGLRIGR